MSISMNRFLSLILFISISLELSAGELERRAFPMLQRLNAAVVERQVTDRTSPEYGAVYCPGCGVFHTRAAEAVFPLAYEYSRTGSTERRDQAIAVAEWLFRRQESDGSWLETPETWTGTTTDQLMMLLLSYPILEKSLTRAERKRWKSSMTAAADYLERVMSNNFASINYCATTAATLSQAWLLLGKDTYRWKAMELAAMIVAKMDNDWFIEGEGEKIGRYKYGVDLGYNLEMSLWGLARYALNTGDEKVLDAVRKSAERHLWFILPDGTMDISAGIRSNKWSIFGSGTSDGCHPLFAMLSAENPAYITAAVRNISKMEECFSSCRLLGQGLMHDEVMGSREPCIYSTFTKAKSLAMAMLWCVEDNDASAPLPTDSDGIHIFETLQMAVAREGAFCGTVTGYNYKAPKGPASKYMHRPAGGSMSSLWVEGYGLLQASSQTEYHRWEPMSFPEMPADIRCLTPRLETVIYGTTFTNLYEYSSRFRFEDGKVTVSGCLCDRSGARSGSEYTVSYQFSDGTLTKSYAILGGCGSELIEPFILYPDVEITLVSDSEIEFRRNGVGVRISCSHPMKLEYDDRYRQVYPSLKAVPITIEMSSPDCVILKYTKI